MRRPAAVKAARQFWVIECRRRRSKRGKWKPWVIGTGQGFHRKKSEQQAIMDALIRSAKSEPHELFRYRLVLYRRMPLRAVSTTVGD